MTPACLAPVPQCWVHEAARLADGAATAAPAVDETNPAPVSRAIVAATAILRTAGLLATVDQDCKVGSPTGRPAGEPTSAPSAPPQLAMPCAHISERMWVLAADLVCAMWRSRRSRSSRACRAVTCLRDPREPG